MEKKLQDLLKEAVEMEGKGYKFYQDFYNALKDKGELPKVELEDKKEQSIKDLSIFSK